jgi:hypothetical protein
MKYLQSIRAAIAAFVLSSSLVLGAGWVHAQSTATATANATGTIIEALTLTRIQDIHFGDIIPGSIATLVTIDGNTGDAILSGGDAIHLGNQQRGQFRITGEPGRAVNIVDGTQTGGQFYVFDITNGSGDVLTVEFIEFPTDAAPGPNIVLPPNGIADFWITAITTIGPNQPTGLYSGSFFLTIGYV